MTLKEAIKHAKTVLGNNVIYDLRIVSALNDFGAFRDRPAYKNILHCLVDDGFIRDYANASSNERDLIVQRVFSLYGFEISFIKDIFSSFFDEDATTSSNTTLQENNHLTEIIFVIDCSSEAASSYASMKFFFDNLKISVTGNLSVRIVYYNDSTKWIVKDGVTLESIVLPDHKQVAFKGANNLSQALIETCSNNIEWVNTISDPIIIWLTATQPQDNFQNIISKLWREDILYNRAYRISVSFGPNISLDTLKRFSSGKDLAFRSIEIEGIIDTIESHCGHDLHDHIEDVINDPGEDLYIKKCKEQTDALNRHEEKLKKYASGIFAFKENGKWGWRKLTGEILVAPQYKNIKEFHEGLAAVSSRGFHGRPFSEIFTWGFINIQGQKIIQEDYDDVESFIRGTAIVHKGQMGWGVINKNGEIVIPCEYYCITRIDNNLFKVMSKSNKYGIYNIIGRQICEVKYDDISDFMNGFTIVRECGISYLMNTNGRIVSRLPTGSKFSPINGIVEIEDYKPKAKTLKGLCGYDGVEILPNIYSTIMYGKMYIVTCSEAGYDVFDLNGQKLNLYPYPNAKINGEFLIVQTNDKKWHYFKDNKIGERVLFNDVYYIFDNGSLLVEYRFDGKPEFKYIATVSTNGDLLRRPYPYLYDKPVVVTEYGINLIRLQFEDATLKSSCFLYINKDNGLLYNYADEGAGMVIKDGFAVVKSNYDKRYTLYNLITGRPMALTTNEDGKTIGKKFDGLQLPSDGYCCFKEHGKYGFIDTGGNTQLEPIYDKATDFKNGLSIVSIGDETFIIDKNGYRLTQKNYEEIKYIQFPINYGNM